MARWSGGLEAVSISINALNQVGKYHKMRINVQNDKSFFLTVLQAQLCSGHQLLCALNMDGMIRCLNASVSSKQVENKF